MSDKKLEAVGKNANSIKSILVVITTALAIVGSVVSGYGFIDTKYAKAADVVQLEKRLSLSELQSSLRLVLDELYFLKKQIRKYPEDIEIKEQLDEVKIEVKDLKDQIKLKKKIITKGD